MDDIFGSMGDIFGDLFGGGRSRGRSNGPMQGANVRASVRVTFEEAALAVRRSLTSHLRMNVQHVTEQVLSRVHPRYSVQSVAVRVRLYTHSSHFSV